MPDLADLRLSISAEWLGDIRGATEALDALAEAAERAEAAIAKLGGASDICQVEVMAEGFGGLRGTASA